jgi:hypothetical protein
MECEVFRERIGADPADLDRACAEHERSCAACAAFAARTRASERLINAALRFDVERTRQPMTSVTDPARKLTPRAWAIAASFVVAAVALWIGSRFVPSDDPIVLAEAVEDHWTHEPESWVRTSTPVEASTLAAALGSNVRIDLERLNVVSYARSCLVNGRWVPHLVVQGDAGPVMVLLLADEPLIEPVPLDIPEEGLRGVITPVDTGSIAILGDDAESFEALEQDVSDAVSWAI